MTIKIGCAIRMKKATSRVQLQVVQCPGELFSPCDIWVYLVRKNVAFLLDSPYVICLSYVSTTRLRADQNETNRLSDSRENKSVNKRNGGYFPRTNNESFAFLINLTNGLVPQANHASLPATVRFIFNVPTTWIGCFGSYARPVLIWYANSDLILADQRFVHLVSEHVDQGNRIPSIRDTITAILASFVQKRSKTKNKIVCLLNVSVLCDT